MELLVLLVASALLCSPAWYIARKRGSWFSWDYVTVFGPPLFWFMLAIAHIGSQSLSNLIELVIVAAFIPLAVWSRVLLLDRFSKAPKRNSLVVCGVCFLVPLILRVAMPTLAE